MTEFFLIGYGGPLMNHGRKKKKRKRKGKITDRRDKLMSNRL
jgi:hypothetical protein